MRSALCTLGAVVLLSGCQAFAPPASHSKIGEKVDWFKLNSDYRSAWMVDGRLCAEPSPETARTVTLVVSADVAKTGVSDTGVKSDFKDAITALNDRSQTLLIMREAFYRLCERQVKSTVSDADFKEAFKFILEKASENFKVEIAKANAAEAGAKAVEAQAKAAQVQAITDLANQNKIDNATLKSILGQ